MPTYLLAHRAPRNYVGNAETVARWNAWFGQLSPSLAERGNPVFARQSLGNCGADTVLGGYTLITADDLEAAVALAQGDPVLAVGGGVEVGELTLIMHHKS